MPKKEQTAVTKSSELRKPINRTPEELRQSLRQYDIETSAVSQAKAIGAIYRVATHEPEVNLRTLLSAVGKLQNLHSLCIRAANLAKNPKVAGNINKDFFLSA